MVPVVLAHAVSGFDPQAVGFVRCLNPFAAKEWVKNQSEWNLLPFVPVYRMALTVNDEARPVEKFVEGQDLRLMKVPPERFEAPISGHVDSIWRLEC